MKKIIIDQLGLPPKVLFIVVQHCSFYNVTSAHLCSYNVYVGFMLAWLFKGWNGRLY